VIEIVATSGGTFISLTGTDYIYVQGLLGIILASFNAFQVAQQAAFNTKHYQRHFVALFLGQLFSTHLANDDSDVH
jgi:hypothetical protein